MLKKQWTQGAIDTTKDAALMDKVSFDGQSIL
jgi:hypothetical protein